MDADDPLIGECPEIHGPYFTEEGLVFDAKVNDIVGKAWGVNKYEPGNGTRGIVGGLEAHEARSLADKLNRLDLIQKLSGLAKRFNL